MQYIKKIVSVCFAFLLLAGCQREPMLHLHEEGADCTMELPSVDLELKMLWDYAFDMDVTYDWKAEWLYGWDDRDKELFGALGYSTPEVFNIRRYYTGNTPGGKHNAPYIYKVSGNHFSAKYDFGYWDVLSWNEVITPDGIQSVRIDESPTYDYVIAHTGESMVPTYSNSKYYNTSSRYTRAFYQPEELFAGYTSGIEINRNLDGFVFDADRNVWVRKLDMKLQPVTYLYLPQIILHHNNRSSRIVTAIDGDANLSGMARSVNLNTGITGSDAITVNFNMRMKFDQSAKSGDKVDIIGGKLLTFGIPKINPSRLNSRAYSESLKEVKGVDLNNRHYIDVRMQFYNGKDSTFVFDVTDQVRRLYRGGVITVSLDMDTIPVPSRKGGSGFDAVVKDYEEKEWEFDM